MNNERNSEPMEEKTDSKISHSWDLEDDVHSDPKPKSE
jgi:hypothetical protein